MSRPVRISLSMVNQDTFGTVCAIVVEDPQVEYAGSGIAEVRG
ncbi:hypothetical protein [Nocardia camponoti]|nr:hypothetical protein [Nocardia camponoti]